MGIFSAIASDINFGLGLLSSFGIKVDVVGIYSGSASQGSGGTSPAPSSGSSIGSSTGSSIINSFLGLPNVTPSFGQMFALARPLKATVRETSRVMEHPAETGVMLADHHIINPVEIELPLLLAAQNYAATFSQIRQAFVNATLLTVKTRAGTYQNMIIADMPHQEDPEMYNVITIGLRLKQVLYFTPGTTSLAQGFLPANTNNNSTIASGLQQAAVVGTKILTAGTAVASYSALINKKLF